MLRVIQAGLPRLANWGYVTPDIKFPFTSWNYFHPEQLVHTLGKLVTGVHNPFGNLNQLDEILIIANSVLEQDDAQSNQ